MNVTWRTLGAQDGSCQNAQLAPRQMVEDGGGGSYGGGGQTDKGSKCKCVRQNAGSERKRRKSWNEARMDDHIRESPISRVADLGKRNQY